MPSWMGAKCMPMQGKSERGGRLELLPGAPTCLARSRMLWNVLNYFLLTQTLFNMITDSVNTIVYVAGRDIAVVSSSDSQFGSTGFDFRQNSTGSGLDNTAIPQHGGF